MSKMTSIKSNLIKDTSTRSKSNPLHSALAMASSYFRRKTRMCTTSNKIEEAGPLDMVEQMKTCLMVNSAKSMIRMSHLI